MKTKLTEILSIKHPIIMAPMYMVSSVEMQVAAMNKGIAACLPAENFENTLAFSKAITQIKTSTNAGALGVSFSPKKYNKNYEKQLQVCIDCKVDFLISNTIEAKELLLKCKQNKIKSFCRVVNLNQAEQAQKNGFDALIAVGKKAGGCKGEKKLSELMPLLVKNIHIPIVVAGGIATGEAIYEAICEQAAAACMIGSIFIATHESKASQAYKNACIVNSSKNIVSLDRPFIVPLSAIETPFLKRLIREKNNLATFLSKISYFKYYFEKRKWNRIMKMLKEATTQRTYKNLWLAGDGIKHVNTIETVEELINRLLREYESKKNRVKIMSRTISRKN